MESRDADATARPTRITLCPDGPLLVRGDVEVVGPDGEVVRSRRRTVAVCRCGRSAIAPWCDGTHRLGGPRPGRAARQQDG